MTTREKRIVATFVELADTLVAEFDVIDFLHTLAYRIVEIVDVDAVGIMLADEDGLPHPAASSSEEARLIELYVAQNCEGPCLDCFRTGQPISRDGLPAMRAAWPAFTKRLEELGFQSAQAVPMRLRDQIIGAVNVFRTRSGQLSPADSRLGQAFADVATVGVIQERAMTASGLLGEQLRTGPGQPGPARAGHGHAGRTHRAAGGRCVPDDAADTPAGEASGSTMLPPASSTDRWSIWQDPPGTATDSDQLPTMCNSAGNHE